MKKPDASSCRNSVAELENRSPMNQLEWSLEDEDRLRLKLDFRILPVVFILFMLCFIDRNARIEGMGSDLNLYGYRFNIALTIFYIPYILVEIPSNVLLKRIGGRFYIPTLVFLFGLVSMCTAFVKGYRGLLACRFLLGLAEGGVLPGIAYYLSTFYRRKELMFRISLFIMGASMAGAFGGLLAAALSKIPHWGTASAPIETWRNIFFLEGLLSMLTECVPSELSG
ncbi:hypothetical protein NM208_g10204 [Fusarium decemcellulare]|uniref:Uncharacterized protein n=1 Tax=Fusarium decemcellulare TaxID=57161 RepID=A0ACC1RYN8_9HYPO|nr:hypothetical protein NM208_g10204 [Fusarium decemcellulare]